MKYLTAAPLLFAAVALASSTPTDVSSPNFYLDQSVKKGDVTFYSEWKTGPGSCGFPVDSNQYKVAALSSKYMQLPAGMTNPNKHPICGSQNCILLKGPAGAMVVKVSDTCAGCKDDDVDVADDAYANLATPDAGRVIMQWKFVDCTKYPLGPYKGDTSSIFASSPAPQKAATKKSTSPKNTSTLPTAVAAPVPLAKSTSTSAPMKQDIELPISDEIKKIVAIPEAKSLYLALIQQVNATLEKIVRVFMKHENINVICSDQESSSSNIDKPKATVPVQPTKSESASSPKKDAAKKQPTTTLQSATPTTQDETTTLTIEEDDEEQPSPMTTSIQPSQSKTTAPTQTATPEQATPKKPKNKKKQKLQALDTQAEQESEVTSTQPSTKTPISSASKKNTSTGASKKPDSKFSSFLNALDIKGDDATFKKFTSFLNSLTDKSEEGAAGGETISQSASKLAKAMKSVLGGSADDGQ